jgi:hypothetical protein
MPHLKDTESGELLRSDIGPAIAADYHEIEASGQFVFNWREEEDKEVYKIYLLDKAEGQILGMMSLIDYPEEYRIHLNLIEVRAEHQGKDKKIDKIAGCMIAFACQLAFVRGYVGFVSLQPKTKLIDWYQEKFGFRQYGRLLGVEQASSNELIKTYLLHEN